MFSAFSRAIGQVLDPSMRRVLKISIVASIVAFIVLWFVAGALLTMTHVLGFGWLDFLIDLAGGVATLVITWLLFPAVVTLISELLAEDICRAVEAKYYPGQPPAREQSMSEVVTESIRFMVVIVIVNLVAMPLYLLLLLVPPLNLFVFYAVNGYLLGREYFELVANRRMDAPAVRALAREKRGKLFFAGAGVAFVMTIPVVNLVAPILAISVMVHLFERWRPETFRLDPRAAKRP
jgi:uncharacterized protein involved in cysteine biosynthesis